MDYTQVTFRIYNSETFATDLLVHCLGDIGFDSFEETTQGIIGYSPALQFDEKAMNTAIEELPIKLNYNYRIAQIPDQNWNSTWEEHSFEPIEIEERCVIHNSQKYPSETFEYDIIINPRQAFGSGYHETTRLIIKRLLNMNLTNKCVLDMGCGTAVLSILSSMLGANSITAIDIDHWSQENAQENIQLNNLSNITVLLGSIELLGQQKFDIILANINRNILLEHLPTYSKVLNPKGSLIVSGFYKQDIPVLCAKAQSVQLSLNNVSEDRNWVSCSFGF